MAENSIVEYFAEHERYRCGYCGSSDTNFSHGMWAHALTVQDYQDLLDRGWRRSGKYVYKPTMDQTCCPMYTIRCEALNFKMRKSHKKVLKKVNKFLIDGIKPSSDKDEELDYQTGGDLDKDGENQSKGGKVTQSESSVSDASSKQEKHITKKGDGVDPSRPSCRKAKELRREKKLAKIAAKASQGSTDNQQQSVGPSHASHGLGAGLPRGEKSLEDWLAEPDKATKCAHKLEIRLIRSGSSPCKEFKSSYEASYKLYKRYQMAVHKEGEEECSKKSYDGFLVQSPLKESHPGGTLQRGYGSFHQQYILDGKIICVGVIDILPSLISSKYLYYDPDYSFLSLGTYSALREMALVRELHHQSAYMKYYYMGFYIHSCPKMKYKGGYFPSYLLCPETYNFCPIEKCAPLLDQKAYARFADESKNDEDGVVDLEKVMVLWQRQVMPYTIYTALKQGKASDEAEVKEYAGFVGRTCAERLFLVRS
ncbi:arginyl-tRNA--protein transferase 1-like isoform X1 [Mya arenaria]|uniref:arginyl-tRNA--protein transferase 1-like isoform X1 n=1 Tax=Mya arenaria TaxID=6604 RepID=UPI0022E76C85|nr:arginyl-tRNA--protein transferase 1-like isoform X1 [Mya arenaria]